MKSLRSPVRWIGAKSVVAPWVISQFCEHHTYVEPFGGGASILLRKQPSPVEVYNDLDKRLYLIFSQLRGRRSGAALKRALRLTPYHEHEFNQAWQSLEKLPDVERARRAIVALRMGFGGTGARGNKCGFGFGKTSNQAAQFRSFVDSLDALIDRLRHVQIMCRDALDVLRRFDGSDTLFFCDPPYVPSTRADSKQYVHEMSLDRHEVLIDELLGLKGKIVISGYANELYDRRLKNWTRIERKVALRVARQKGQSRTEVIWRNY